MATCTYCEQEMKTADGCTEGPLHLDGVPWERVPHRRLRGSTRSEGRCGDCGTLPDRLHHPGCDMESCPRCRRQLFFACECPWDEHRDTLALSDADDEAELDRLRLVSATLSSLDPDPLEPEPPEPSGLDPSTPDPGALAGTATNVPPTHLVPFEGAMAPIRARHHGPIVELARWALASGRRCDRAVAALVLDLRAEQLEDDRHDDLRRNDVNGFLRYRMSNRASIAGTILPDDWVETLWTVVHWWHAEGHLGDGSDPLPALLEPLQCAGGLDADGHPRPDDIDVDFPCQCFLPFDPTCPPGTGLLIVGHDTDTFEPLTVHAVLRHRSDDPPTSTLTPLLRLFRRVEDGEELTATVPVDELELAGRFEGDRWTPALTCYRHVPTLRRGFDPLAVDDDGGCWVPRRDRRRKSGFRWVAARPAAALRRAGIDPYAPRPTTFDQDLETLDPTIFSVDP